MYRKFKKKEKIVPTGGIEAGYKNALMRQVTAVKPTGLFKPYSSITYISTWTPIIQICFIFIYFCLQISTYGQGFSPQNNRNLIYSFILTYKLFIDLHSKSILLLYTSYPLIGMTCYKILRIRVWDVISLPQDYSFFDARGVSMLLSGWFSVSVSFW